MGFYEVDNELSSMDLNVALLIVPPMEFTFCHNCLRSIIWFEKSFLLQRYGLLNCFSVYNLLSLTFYYIDPLESSRASQLFLIYLLQVWLYCRCCILEIPLSRCFILFICQRVGLDVIVTIIIILGFVVGLSRSAGLDNIVRFLIKLSRYSIALLISIVMVTRFLKVTQLVLSSLLFSENIEVYEIFWALSVYVLAWYICSNVGVCCKVYMFILRK